MEIIRLNLQLPEKLAALLLQVRECLGGASAVIAGGYLRSLYFQECLGLAAKVTDVDIFAHSPPVPNSAFEQYFGLPFFRMDMEIMGEARVRLDYTADPEVVKSDMLQIILSPSGEWANWQDYLEDVNAYINAVVFDGKNVWCRREFLEDCQSRVLRLNAVRFARMAKSSVGLAHHGLLTSMKKLRDYLSRHEFKGFRLEDDVGRFYAQYAALPATGGFWEK